MASLQPPALNIVVVPHAATPQLHGPQPVAKNLPTRERQNFEMIPSDLAERATNAIAVAVNKGSPRSIATIDSCLPEGWRFDPTADVDLQQPTAASHWEMLLRAGAIPK
jgi:hypothetical protein